MKKSFLVFVVLLCSCVGVKRYVEPSNPNSAVLKVNDMRVVKGEEHTPKVGFSIDGELVTERAVYIDKETGIKIKSYAWSDSAKVNGGVHKVRFFITAFNGKRAKFNEFEIDINFKNNHIYEVDVDIPKIVSKEPLGDSGANITIYNVQTKEVVYENLIALKDNHERSFGTFNPNVMDSLTTDLINHTISNY